MRNKKARTLRKLAVRLATTDSVLSIPAYIGETVEYPKNSARRIYKTLKKDCAKGGK